MSNFPLNTAGNGEDYREYRALKGFVAPWCDSIWVVLGAIIIENNEFNLSHVETLLVSLLIRFINSAL